MVKILIEYLGAQSKKELTKTAGYADMVDGNYEVVMMNEDVLNAEMPSQTGRDYYDVYISSAGKELSVECDCESFNQAGGCKHINTVIAEWLALEHTAKYGIGNGTSTLEIINSALDGQLPAFFPTEVKKAKNSKPKAGKFSELENGWIEVPDDPMHISYNYPIWFGLGRITKKAMNALVKMEFDNSKPYWKYRFKTTLQKYFEVEIKYDGEATFQFHCSCGVSLPVCM